MQSCQNLTTELFTNKISVSQIVDETTVDGPGFRISIYCAGCPHRCVGCHNPQTWKIDSGNWMSIDAIYEQVEESIFCDVTFSGGDPMFQPVAFKTLAKKIKENTTKNIWCYTGYQFESLLKNSEQLSLLRYVDVLVDGPYIEQESDVDLLFRGSRNQRLIDVQASLQNNEVILWTRSMDAI